MRLNRGKMGRYLGLVKVDTEHAKLVDYVLEMARLEGCVCSPDITIPPGGLRAGGTARIKVAHDEWCPLVRDN